ncbi:MAG: stage II sporulation protein R [Bacillota bacterium]|nr:stage II sporulation protein R [Bacillota bacterium]
MPVLKRILLLFLILQLVFLPGAGREDKSLLLRLHIRANSDSAGDQAVKYLVRNRVLAALEKHLLEAECQKAAVQKTAKLLPEIQAAAEAALAEAGCSYRARVILGNTKFPTRMYGNKIYRAGRYEALQIFLGEGRGKNWWCVLFPPLCFIAPGEEQTGEEEVTAECAEHAERKFFPLPFKSRLLEWLRRLLGR